MKIGQRLFTDGVTRDVYQGADGRQYVLDDTGQPVYGVWILTEQVEEGAPLVVYARPQKG